MTTDSENSPQIERKQKQRSGSKSPEPSKRRKRDESPPGKGRSDKKKSHKSKRSRSRSRSKDRKDKRHKYHDLDKPVEDEYPRYYGEDLEERLNSDRYWTKYPRKDNNVIGSRYYSAEANKEADKAKTGHGEEADKASKGGDKAAADKSVVAPRERKAVDMLTSRTGGAYIPPAKLRLMQAEITDKTSAAYQRIAWEALKKSIHGFINKVNTSNIGIIARELLQENVVRGRGLLCKSIIQAQAASPTFTNVYSALVAVINSKFPNIGELLLKRLVLQFKRGFKQNNKVICISATTFVAHLVNQRVAHEILALEILTLLVESPTDDSVEVAISFLKECGQKLTEVSSKGINAIFEMLRNILHEGQLEKRIQYMIEVMFQVRKDGFKDHAAIIEELDLVDEEHQFTHLITLDDVKQVNSEEILNVFKFDDNYEENEGKYKTLSKEILDQSGSESEGESGSGSEDDDDDDEEGEAAKSAAAAAIIDNTETNLIALRRTIYLTIQSSLDFEESAHKLMKMELKPGQEIELCHMFLDCCAEQRTYEKFYGLLAQRFCQVNRIYIGPFQQIFKDTYSTTHRLDTNKLRNVSKFFAHLMFTDAIGWEVLDAMKLNEEDTNSSNRIFIKILFQELAEYMGLEKLNTRLKDPTLQVHFSGLFPRDDPKNTRFAINFFTSIGLGGLTAELREHLKNAPKVPTVNLAEKSSSSDSSGSSSSSSEESSDESGSSSSSSDEEARKKRSVKKKKKSEGGKGEKKRERRSEDKGSSSSRRRKDSVSSKQSSKKEEGGSSKRHDDRSKKHEEKARRHEDRARGAEEKARRHEDKPRRDEDRARRDEDRARKSRDEGRRKRSPEERHRSRRH